MPTIDELIEKNRLWAADITKNSPEFFSKLSEGQQPEYLWIGCADSRVPASQVIGVKPGEVFVHRNIANLIKKDDASCMSVIQYAVDVLKVKHIIVTGHYNCGGVAAAISGDKIPGKLGTWIEPIKTVHKLNIDELHAEDPKANLNRMCELNVLDQTSRLSTTETVTGAWARGQSLQIHSWIYNLEDGKLKTLRGAIGAPEEV